MEKMIVMLNTRRHLMFARIAANDSSPKEQLRRPKEFSRHHEKLLFGRPAKSTTNMKESTNSNLLFRDLVLHAFFCLFGILSPLVWSARRVITSAKRVCVTVSENIRTALFNINLGESFFSRKIGWVWSYYWMMFHKSLLSLWHEFFSKSSKPHKP